MTNHHNDVTADRQDNIYIMIKAELNIQSKSLLR
jgi:hypothetical protein